MSQASPKKIIQLSTFFHPSVGGVERQVEEIAAHLHQLGYQVEVFTTDATHGSEKRMQRLEDNFRGLKVRRFRYLIAFGDFFRFAPLLLWSLLWEDYDIIHVHNSHDAHLLGALIIKALRHKKLVITGHNPYIVGSEKRGQNLGLGVKIFEFVLRRFHRQVDKYVALLESERLAVMKHLKLSAEQIVVIPNGIQELFYESGGAKEKFFSEWGIDSSKWKLVVGAVCRLNYVKGLQNLLQAVRELPEVLFVFVGGDDGYYAQLKRMYNQFSNVIFTQRYIPPTEVKDFYQAIDIFLLPSIYEPFGMTVVEAMSQGKLILATTNGGVREIVDPSFGELIPPTDQQAWKDRIEYYANHPDEIAQKQSAAISAAQKYNWQIVIKDLEQVYKSV